jgi:uncharacterized protein (DUF58 family)
LRSDALGKISRLQLIARGVVEGFITGHHRSPYKGSSVEFAEHRQYVPGDDIRELDWRVYGKSDRYYVKQFTEETNLRSTLLLDASGSMAYTGDRAAKIEGKPVSKFEYAQFLAASLLYLLINQQDAVGLVTFDTRIRRYIPSRATARHMRVLLQEMEQLEVGGETALAPVFHDIAERVHRRGLVIVISDLFDNVDDLIEAFHHFRFRKHEVVVLHVMADEELTFPFDNWSDFKDLENHFPHTELDPLSVRAEYLENVHKFVRGIETACGQMEIDYVPMNTRVPFDVALAGLLASRNNRS